MNLLHLPWLELVDRRSRWSARSCVSRLRDPAPRLLAGAWRSPGRRSPARSWPGWPSTSASRLERGLALQPAATCCFGRQLFALDELSAPLVPAVALLHFLTALATARTQDAAVLVLLVAGRRGHPPGDVQLQGALGPDRPAGGLDRAAVRRAAQPRPADAGLRHRTWRCSSACWSSAGRPSRSHGRGSGRPPGGRSSRCWLAILVRCGTVPAHCWVTDWFEHASFGIALLFVIPLGRRLRRRPARPADRAGLGAARHRRWSRCHGRLCRRHGDRSSDEARRFFAAPVPQPRVAGAGRAGAAHRALADGLALPLVLGDPLAGRLRPDAPGPRGPLRPALADRLPRPLRALADPGRLLPADGPGQRRLPRHARLHLDRAAGRQRRRGQSLRRHRRGRRGRAQRHRRGPRLLPALHRRPARLDGLAGDRRCASGSPC